jgi:hypothetical protein
MDIMLHNRSHNSDLHKGNNHGNRRNIRTADTDR